jgi:CheY-like chemotaxis protein
MTRVRSPGVRVLVADDNVDAGDALGTLLEIDGYEVLLARDGAQAVEMALESRPAIVILDIGMPVMDGLEAARRLRATAEGRTMCLIALTGWDREKDRELTRAAGFDAHVVKPLSIESLREVLENLPA